MVAGWKLVSSNKAAVLMVFLLSKIREADAGLEISDELIQFAKVLSPNLAVDDLYHHSSIGFTLYRGQN